MSDDVKKPLNLDELFGQDAPVKVRWQGKEYELQRLEALGAKGVLQFQKLYGQATELQSAGDELSNEQVEMVDTMFDQMLKALCPSLPLDTMPFLAKTRALTYYIDETQGKKALETAPNKTTGETSSAG